MNPHAYLLDVNVLILLVDPMHVHHRRAKDWFSASGSWNWLTCPTTQNGTTRIGIGIGIGPKYSQNGFTPSMVIDVGNHSFVPDNIGLLHANHINAE